MQWTSAVYVIWWWWWWWAFPLQQCLKFLFNLFSFSRSNLMKQRIPFSNHYVVIYRVCSMSSQVVDLYSALCTIAVYRCVLVTVLVQWTWEVCNVELWWVCSYCCHRLTPSLAVTTLNGQYQHLTVISRLISSTCWTESWTSVCPTVNTNSWIFFTGRPVSQRDDVNEWGLPYVFVQDRNLQCVPKEFSM